MRSQAKKNTTKSEMQRQTLQLFYTASGGDWSRNQLEAIAEDIDLTRQQVYKWLWDKKKTLQKSRDSNIDKWNSEPQIHTFKYNRCSIRVPTTLQRASKFTVDPSVSIWAIEILRRQGWQLCLNNLPPSNQTIKEEQSDHLPIRIFDDYGSIEGENIFKMNKFEMVHEEIEENYSFLGKGANEPAPEVEGSQKDENNHEDKESPVQHSQSLKGIFAKRLRAEIEGHDSIEHGEIPLKAESSFENNDS